MTLSGEMHNISRDPSVPGVTQPTRSDGQTIAFLELLSEPKSRSILIFVCVTPSLNHSAPFYEITSKFLI